MMVILFVSRDLSRGDDPVVELNDSSESRLNETPVGPTVLDLKYVSTSETRAGDVQQLNPGPNVDEEIDQNPCTEVRGNGEPRVGAVEQPNQIPYAQVISSLENDLKEGQVIRDLLWKKLQA